MSTLVRSPESTLSHLLHWLGVEPPETIEDLAQLIPVESFNREGTYVVRADIPGVDPEKDIEITLDSDVLTISGERREEKHEEGRSEVRYGTFTRRIRLPHGTSTDDVRATYDAGVLEVTVPVADSPAEPVRIAVQAAAADADGS